MSPVPTTTRHLIQLVPLTAPVVPTEVIPKPSARETSSSLDLFAEVVMANGTRYRWGGNQAPGSRMRDLSFRTKIGEGFSDATLQLARRIDLDYPDLELVSSVTISGNDGSIAYEGRVSSQPRDLGDSHSISVTLAGWMAHAKDRKFTEIFVDRDLKGWGDPSLGRKGVLMTANFVLGSVEQTWDVVDGTPGVTTVLPDGWVTYKPQMEAWYDAGPNQLIGKMEVSWKREPNTGISPADTNWSWRPNVSDTDKGATVENGAEQRAAGPAGVAFTPTAKYRYGILSLGYAATPGGAQSVRYSIAWYKLAVYGNHNLPTFTGEPAEPSGVHASDVIKDIAARWCPLLDVSQVQDTTYVIQHLAFKDRTFPYDAFLEINKYHLWHLGVWERRQLTFRPYDLTDYNWEVRTDDPGTTFDLQGPSTENLFNGISVTYTDLLSGISNTLNPDTNVELADVNPDNPWNKYGIDHWDEIELSTPTLRASALEIGRAALADRNRPKTPGTITVRGYVRDRQGNTQPCWKVRAGDTIAITNFPNDSPRLIVETDYDDNQKQVRLAIEMPFQLLEALLDRQTNAFTAKGLA